MIPRMAIRNIRWRYHYGIHCWTRNYGAGHYWYGAGRRCCADNAIVTYTNATFYPKMVADVTTGTGTTAQSTYNPIPKCNTCCNGNG